MKTSPEETIAAIASAPGMAQRGIIRISGHDVTEVLHRLGVRPSESCEATGQAKADWSFTEIRSPQRVDVEVPVADGTLQLPGHILLWPTTRSFTGEPLAELHLPGSPPLLNEVLEEIWMCGARPAERGEFTLRAFLAGRIDLVQAEAVLGVIDAGNARELESALEQLAGGISGRMAELREQLLLHLADLEAGLDFVEEDIEFVAREELQRRLKAAGELIGQILKQSTDRMLTHGRPRVVLAGLPNAGKSTLFNRLIGRQAALVSSVAGTTRDYLSAAISYRGIHFDLIDTAGWEDSRDGIEAAASQLRADQYQRAQLVVWCIPSDLTEEDRKRNGPMQQRCQEDVPMLLPIRTKADQSTSISHMDEDVEISVSAQQGDGMEELLAAISSRLSTSDDRSEMIGATAARCAESLRHAAQGIERALQLIDLRGGDELIALELRDVLEQLGRILGQVYTDDILDRIFSRFCIGK